MEEGDGCKQGIGQYKQNRRIDERNRCEIKSQWPYSHRQYDHHQGRVDDSALERSAKGIINSAFGCAGERCMALPVVVAQEGIADRLVELLDGRYTVVPGYENGLYLGPTIFDYVTEDMTIGSDEILHIGLNGLRLSAAPAFFRTRSACAGDGTGP